MSVLGLIPVDNNLGFYSERIALGASVFVLSIRFNSRMGKWILDVADANNVTLLGGIPILGNWPLTDRFHNLILGLPEGTIAALDLLSLGRDPDENTLGSDMPLFYSEP